MERVLDLSKSVYDLAMEHEDFLDIMESVGFTGLRNCVKTKEHPKQITVPMAVANHELDLNHVLGAFEKAGYTIMNQ